MDGRCKCIFIWISIFKKGRSTIFKIVLCIFELSGYPYHFTHESSGSPLLWTQVTDVQEGDCHVKRAANMHTKKKKIENIFFLKVEPPPFFKELIHLCFRWKFETNFLILGKLTLNIRTMVNSSASFFFSIVPYWSVVGLKENLTYIHFSHNCTVTKPDFTGFLFYVGLAQIFQV